MRNQINDKKKLGGKISDEDKETIEEAVTEAIDWLDENEEADLEEYEDKVKELEGKCSPIVSKLYAKGGGEGGGDADDFGDDDDHDEL
jgi:heat shock protein 5